MKTNSIKAIVLTAAFAAISIASFGQVKYGPVLGVNLANLSGDIENNTVKVGLHAGAMVDFHLSDMVSISPQLLFSMKGSQNKDDSKDKINLNFIEVPVHVKINLESGLNFYGGPYLGLLMSAKAVDGDNDIDIKDSFKGMDFGLSAGLGYQLENGLGFGARYGLGLADISDEEGFTVSTNTICVSINYLIGGD